MVLTVYTCNIYFWLKCRKPTKHKLKCFSTILFLFWNKVFNVEVLYHEKKYRYRRLLTFITKSFGTVSATNKCFRVEMV